MSSSPMPTHMLPGPLGRRLSPAGSVPGCAAGAGVGGGGVSSGGSSGHFSRFLLVPDRQMQIAQWLYLCGMVFAALLRAGEQMGPEDLGDTSRYGALVKLA